MTSLWITPQWCSWRGPTKNISQVLLYMTNWYTECTELSRQYASLRAKGIPLFSRIVWGLRLEKMSLVWFHFFFITEDHSLWKVYAITSQIKVTYDSVQLHLLVLYFEIRKNNFRPIGSNNDEHWNGCIPQSIPECTFKEMFFSTPDIFFATPDTWNQWTQRCWAYINEHLC